MKHLDCPSMYAHTLVDPGDGAAGAPHPKGSRFFHFDTQIFRNVTASGVGPPLRYGVDRNVNICLKNIK